MPENIKIFWLGMLERGRYQRAEAAMRDGNRYCPLGLLCELYRVTQGKGEWAKIGHFWYFQTKDRRGKPIVNDAIPPLEVMVWAGIDEQDCLMIQNLSDGQIGNGVIFRPVGFKKIAWFVRHFL